MTDFIKYQVTICKLPEINKRNLSDSTPIFFKDKIKINVMTILPKLRPISRIIMYSPLNLAELFDSPILSKIFEVKGIK